MVASEEEKVYGVRVTRASRAPVRRVSGCVEFEQVYIHLAYIVSFSLDWFGTIVCIGIVTSLLLPLQLQWGSVTKSWIDPKVRVCAFFPVFAVLRLCFFIYYQWRRGPRAILPLAIIERRAVIGTASEAFFLYFGILVGTYYLPLWYQATQGQSSATKSGLDMLPFVLSVVVCQYRHCLSP